MPRQVPTPRTVEIPSAEAVAKERERLQYKKKYNRTLRSTIDAAHNEYLNIWLCWSPRFFCRCWRMN